jgi:4-amino-4-deoxy-L-arabinose transferase-like glycosyltransferase
MGDHSAKPPDARPTLRLAILGLLFILAFDVAWRWHTIGPSPVSKPFEGWLVRSGETEPLDCDEAAYAYMGRRMLRGDVLYRDLTENKPPLGYWLYTLAVGIGGANELAIRFMAIPYVLATIALVWWIGLRLGGGAAACLGALVFAIASADPHVFGNGSNMEHFLNLFSVASLALMLRASDCRSRWMIVAAGVCVALATLVKQVAAAQGVVYAVALALPSGSRRLRERLGDVGALAIGFLVPCAVALGIVIAQGAGREAYEDMVLFPRAMATEGPPNLHGPPKLVRWVTGNADARGELPWPFGTSTNYDWWGAGLWPLWLVSLPATIRLLFGEWGGRRMLGWWIVATWVQVILPGMYWQHYYLLLTPGVALTVSFWLVDAVSGIRGRPIPNSLIAIALLTALGWTLRIQFRDYLGRTPDEITSEFKGGKQWVSLRALGREVAARSKVWDDPRLFVWGWQSPLFIYSGLDGVTRHFFANDFLKAHATDNHPLVGPWIDEILRDLHARPPALIFAGEIPFPALRKFLDEHYLPSLLTPPIPDGRGLWVEKDRYGEFHARPTVRP